MENQRRFCKVREPWVSVRNTVLNYNKNDPGLGMHSAGVSGTRRGQSVQATLEEEHRTEWILSRMLDGWTAQATPGAKPYRRQWNGDKRRATGILSLNAMQRWNERKGIGENGWRGWEGRNKKKDKWERMRKMVGGWGGGSGGWGVIEWLGRSLE